MTARDGVLDLLWLVAVLVVACVGWLALDLLLALLRLAMAS